MCLLCYLQRFSAGFVSSQLDNAIDSQKSGNFHNIQTTSHIFLLPPKMKVSRSSKSLVTNTNLLVPSWNRDNRRWVLLGPHNYVRSPYSRQLWIKLRKAQRRSWWFTDERPTRENRTDRQIRGVNLNSSCTRNQETKYFRALSREAILMARLLKKEKTWDFVSALIARQWRNSTISGCNKSVKALPCSIRDFKPSDEVHGFRQGWKTPI